MKGAVSSLQAQKAGLKQRDSGGFDFAFNPQIPAKKITGKLCLYRQQREYFLLGPVGWKELYRPGPWPYCMQDGIRCPDTKAAKMFRYLNGGRADNSWDRRTDILLPIF
jgi:hypothetical protein